MNLSVCSKENFGTSVDTIRQNRNTHEHIIETAFPCKFENLIQSLMSRTSRRTHQKFSHQTRSPAIKNEWKRKKKFISTSLFFQHSEWNSECNRPSSTRSIISARPGIIRTVQSPKMKQIISGSSTLLLSACFVAWITTFTSPAESFSASFFPSTRDSRRNLFVQDSCKVHSSRQPRRLSSRVVLHVSKLRDDDVSTVEEEDDDEELLRQTKKSELVALCENFELSTKGTKEELLARLRVYADSKIEEE